MLTAIYVLEDPNSGEIRYIGKTRKPSNRLACHASTIKPTPVSKWCRLLASRGVRPRMRIVSVHIGSAWIKAEQNWIRLFRALGADLLNVTGGGGGMRLASLETREKMSRALKGRPKPSGFGAKIARSNRGRQLSAETREKIAASKRGKALSAEHKLALSRAHAGVPKSPEHVEKVAMANRGQKRTAEQRAKFGRQQIR